MMPRRLGIIAGGGALPRRLARHCHETGGNPFVIVLDGQASATDFADLPHAEYRLGAAGSAVKRLRQENVDTILLAGDVDKPALSALRPDLPTVRLLMKAGVFSVGDDTLLQALIRVFEDEGFAVVGAHDILPDLLAPLGCLTSATPAADALRDIAAGVAAARALGARDAGQAVVVANGMILAEEDRRGTDAMLAGIASDGRGVLVKTLKPGQERRADLPTIGPGTVASVAHAALAGIAVSAGDALILEREACLAAAEAAGIFIVGIDLAESEGGETDTDGAPA